MRYSNAELVQIGTEKGLDEGWPAYYASLRADDPSIERRLDIAAVAEGYAAFPVRAANRMRAAVGYQSRDLYRLAHMLLVVQEKEIYDADTMARIRTCTWDRLLGEAGVIERGAHAASRPCGAMEILHAAGLRRLVHGGGSGSGNGSGGSGSTIDNPAEVRGFVTRLASVSCDARIIAPPSPRSPGLSPLEVAAVLCAEVWCTWAARDLNHLPPAGALAGLFGRGVAEEVKALKERLEIAYTSERVKENILHWCGRDAVFLNEIDALASFVNDL